MVYRPFIAKFVDTGLAFCASPAANLKVLFENSTFKVFPCSSCIVEGQKASIHVLPIAYKRTPTVYFEHKALWVLSIMAF